MREEFESYFVRALHDAKIRELVDTYSKKGFRIREGSESSDEMFDLLVEDPKTGKITAFEVKVSPVAPEAEAQIRRLLETAQSKDYEFRLVTINRPTRYSITIDWLDDALFQYLIDHPLEELDELSTHTEYDRVSTQIRSIRITNPGYY